MARALREGGAVAQGPVRGHLIAPVSLIHGIRQLCEALSKIADHFPGARYLLIVCEKSALLRGAAAASAPSHVAALAAAAFGSSHNEGEGGLQTNK